MLTSLTKRICATKIRNIILEHVRFARHKPWIPKFRILRQIQPFDPPFDYHDFVKNTDQTPSDERVFLKRNGILPAQYPLELPTAISCTDQIFDKFVPPEEDGSSSLLSKAVSGTGTKISQVYSYRKALFTLKRHDKGFDHKLFPNEAENIYLEAHKLLQDYSQNEARLLELVTEKAYAHMTNGLSFRTLIWRFVGSLEPPRLVNLACQSMVTKENVYAQATIRFNTQQIFALYDRFGRLLYGHPTSPADVLEYVVLEKHAADEYGRWRIHDKVPRRGSQQKEENDTDVELDATSRETTMLRTSRRILEP